MAEPFLHGDIHPYMFSLLGSLRLQPEVGFPKSLFGIRQRNATKRLFGLPPIRPKSNTILKKWPQKKYIEKTAVNFRLFSTLQSGANFYANRF